MKLSNGELYLKNTNIIWNDRTIEFSTFVKHQHIVNVIDSLPTFYEKKAVLDYFYNKFKPKMDNLRAKKHVGCRNGNRHRDGSMEFDYTKVKGLVLQINKLREILAYEKRCLI